MNEQRIISAILLGSLALNSVAMGLGSPPSPKTKGNSESDYGYFYSVENPYDTAKAKYQVIKAPHFLSRHLSVPLANSEAVIGFEQGGRAWCFPLRLMTYHHIAHFEVEGERMAMTYCGMANSAVLYRPDFGSGYVTLRGDKVRQAEHVNLEVAGSFSGTLVFSVYSASTGWMPEPLGYHPQINPRSTLNNSDTTPAYIKIGSPVVITDFGDWVAKYPHTAILQPVEKYSAQYADYDAKPKGYSILKDRDRSIKMRDKRLTPGHEVFGIAIGQDAECWTIEEVKRRKTVYTILGGKDVRVAWDAELKTPVVLDPPEDLLATRCYWYSWSSFYLDVPLNGLSARSAVTDWAHY